MSRKIAPHPLPPPGLVCAHPRCSRIGVSAFASDPDDMRCEQHHGTELARRIAALDAARELFIALVGGGRP